MTNWIQTKAGLQMAETIVRTLPKMLQCLQNLSQALTVVSADRLVKDVDVEKLIDNMDILKQENINLSHRIHKLEK
jgi:cell division protein FtsB